MVEIAVAFAVIGFGHVIFQQVRRKRLLKMAMRPECLICSHDVEEDALGDYTCGHCGYRRALEKDPAMMEPITLFREAKQAEYSFERATSLYRQASSVVGTGTEAKERRNQLRNEADREMLSGMDFLTHLVELEPDLFQSADLKNINGGAEYCGR